MALKVFKSNLTWRTGQQQDEAISALLQDWPDRWPDVSSYNGADEIPGMLRATSRKEPITIYAASLGVFADNEKDFIALLVLCKKRKARIITLDGGYSPSNAIKATVTKWRAARKNGAAKIGGKMSADIKKAKSAEAIAKIKDRWPLPSKEWPTKVLLKEADVSLNTVKSLLGKRPIAQYNYQAKMKRKESKNNHA